MSACCSPIAYFGDKRADAGRSIIANPYIYALSLGVYATAWTFYGSVGRAASDGVGFLPIYIGPTLMMALWWLVVRKIIRISKTHRITSLADFVSSRYGKSALLAGLVTIIAVVGIVPYIALQLKAISGSYTILATHPDLALAGPRVAAPFAHDTAFWVALLLAVFAILFGTRHLDASERHEGMVAAIAFESIVKLVAFLAVGAFVTYGMYDGMGDLFARAAEHPRLSTLFAPLSGAAGGYANWAWLTLLSMLAILFLPRQFQIAVVENVNEQHIGKAVWLFPLYMLAMNVFVVPIAFGGVLHFQGTGVDPDTFVLTLPMAEQAARAGAARVRRRPVGGDGHGDRRDDRAVDDGLQRPRDAGAAAHARHAVRRAARPDRPAARHPAGRHRRHRAAGLPVLPAGRRGATRWSRSGSSRSRRWRSSRRR